MNDITSNDAGKKNYHLYDDENGGRYFGHGRDYRFKALQGTL